MLTHEPRPAARAPANEAPLVSVIVPACNAERTILDTIDSVRRQTVASLEIIVIDDGSTDGTPRVLSTICDPRLHVHSYPNGGLGAARNRGIEHARGTLLSFIDADDLWTPDKLEAQMAVLASRPDAALAYSWTAFIDRDGRFLFAKDALAFEGDVRADLLRECFVANGSNILVRASAARAVGGFDTSLAAAQDWDFCLRIAARWPFAVVPRYQVLYRIAEGVWSADAERSERTCLLVCDRAFAAMPDLPASCHRQGRANVKQYVAFLYLTRAADPDARRQAERRLIESIRIWPGLLRSRRAWHLLLTSQLLRVVPAARRRALVLALLRIWGQWLRARRVEVRRLLAPMAGKDPARSPHRAARPG